MCCIDKFNDKKKTELTRKAAIDSKMCHPSFKTALLGVLMLAMLSSCISRPAGDKAEKERSESSLTSAVSPAPIQTYIKAAQSKQFAYWGHNITINYTSSHPKHVIKATVDGSGMTFERGHTDDPRGIYWRAGNLTLAIKPVVWETRNGQEVPIYEGTWDVSEIYFEVFVSGGGPERRENRDMEVLR